MSPVTRRQNGRAVRANDRALDRILWANQAQADHLFLYPPGVTLERNRGIVPPGFFAPIAGDALLYAHVPFCHSICKFCNIYKEPHPGQQGLQAYLDALLAEAGEMSRRIDGTRFVSAYVGGGTPTVLSAEQLDTLLGELRRLFKLGTEVPFEIDATPSSVTPQKTEVMRRHGVRYLSMGIQTLEERVLSAVDRKSQNALLSRLPHMLSGSGFKIHFDFIVGLPGDTLSAVRRDIDRVVREFAPTSLSVNTYDHTRDTLFARERSGPDFSAPARLRRMGAAVEVLQDYVRRRHGLQRGPLHYFPRVAAGAGVIGLGAGAYGYLPGAVAYRNLPYSDYMRPENAGIKKFRPLNSTEDRRSFIIHNLASDQLFASYKKRFGSALDADFPEPCADLAAAGRIDSTVQPRRFVFSDRNDARAAEVRFYSAETLACYGL